MTRQFVAGLCYTKVALPQPIAGSRQGLPLRGGYARIDLLFRSRTKPKDLSVLQGIDACLRSVTVGGEANSQDELGDLG